MRALRCLQEKRDDLHEWAERFLNTTPLFMLNAGLGLAKDFGDVQTAILHREFLYQAEMVVVSPNFTIPAHAHPDVDSIEFPLAGLLRFQLNGKDPLGRVSDSRALVIYRGRGLRIDRDCVHGGTACADGAMFISFQRWSVLPTHIGHNWVDHA